MDGGGHLGQVQQHIREQLVHGARHLEDEGGQRHDGDLVTGPGQQSTLETLDQLGLEVMVQVSVVARQSCQDRVDGAMELGSGKFDWSVESRKRMRWYKQ